MGLVSIIISVLALLLGAYAAFIKKPKEPKQVDLSGLKNSDTLMNSQIETLKKEMKKKPDVVKDTKGNYSIVHDGVIIKEYLQ